MVYVLFPRSYANKGVDGWVRLYLLFTQIEKTVQINGRSLMVRPYRYNAKTDPLSCFPQYFSYVYEMLTRGHDSTQISF